MGKLLGTKYWGMFGVSTMWFAGMSTLYGAVLGYFLTMLYILIDALSDRLETYTGGADSFVFFVMIWINHSFAGGVMGAMIGGLIGLLAGGFSSIGLILYKYAHLSGAILHKILYMTNPCFAFSIIYALFIRQNGTDLEIYYLVLSIVVAMLATLHGTQRFLQSEQVGEGHYYVKPDIFPVADLFNQ